MKNLKQIILATLLVAIMLTTVAVSVFAGDSISLEDFEKVVLNIESLKTPEQKEYAIRYAMLDLQDPEFDPTADGFAELMVRFCAQNTLCATLYIAKYDSYVPTGDVSEDAEARYAILNSAIRLLANEYSSQASDYAAVMAEYYTRHVSLLSNFVATTDAAIDYEGKNSAIKTVLKYLDVNAVNFTEENYSAAQLEQINATLTEFGNECVEFINLGNDKLVAIENDPLISNKANPLNKSNTKRAVLEELVPMADNDYVKLSPNYSECAESLASISMTLLNDLASIAELTEIPSGVADAKAFAYLKNAILIDIDQIDALGFSVLSDEYDAFVERKSALNLSVLSIFIDMIPTEYHEDYRDGVNPDSNVDCGTEQLHYANSTIKQVKNILNRYFKDAEGEELAAQMAKFDERCDLFKAAYDKYVIYRDNCAPLSDYENIDALLSFDGVAGPKPTLNSMNNVSGVKTYTDLNGVEDTGLVFKPEGGQPYMQFSSANYYNTVGLVYEFDITTFDDEYKANIWFNHGSTTRTSTGESLFPPNFMGIVSGGSLREGYESSSKLILENVIVPGQWTRIALVYDAGKCEYSIYVDGILAQKGRDAKISGSITWYATALRINAINTDGDTAVLDNFKFYQGSALRTYDRYLNMSNEEKFLTYADIYSNEKLTPPVRLQAYELGAQQLIYGFYDTATGDYLTDNQAINDVIDNKYLAFDYDAILSQYQEELMLEFWERVTALKNESRGFEVSKRKSQLSSVQAFISANGNYLVKGAWYEAKDANGNVIERFDYNTLATVMENVSAQIAQDTLLKDFCAKMKRYDRASTTVAKQRYYSEATLLREDPTFDTSLVKLDVYNPAEGVKNSLTLSVAWEMYVNAAAELDQMVRSDNSETIIKCVNVIKQYDTVEEWEANFDYVNSYVVIMREIINSGEYDDEVVGFTDAKVFYDSVNEYFYNVLQESHVAILTAELDKFPLLKTYIEKIGFCLFIDEYIANNDIDYSNKKIKEVIDRYEIYIADIGAAEEDYQGVLDQNTKYFVNLVNELQTCIKYEDIKAKITEAATYLHTMNVGDPAAEAAVAIYEEYDARMKRYEESYRQFEIHTALIATCVTEDDMFEVLVNCNLYKADVDAILTGVAEDDNSSEMYANARAALAIYNAAYSVYNAKISGVNVNVSAILQLVVTLRDPAQIDNVVATMLTLAD